MNTYFEKNIYVEKICEDGLFKNAMTRLPLGDVSVDGGWLRGQLDLMCEGVTGRLPEFGPYFGKQRNGYIYSDVASGWEEVPYWIRGFYPMAVLTQNKEHLKTAQTYFEALFASVQEDGWFGPAYLKEFKEINGEMISDVFPHMMLLDALILYFEQTKDDRVLSLMDGFFEFCKNIPDEKWLPRTHSRLMWQKIRAGDMLTPIYWYYRKTGKEWLLALAKRFYDGIWESSTPYVAYHAVDFAQRFGYSAVYSQQSGDSADFERSEKQYEDYKAVWGQLPRGIFAADEQVREGCVDPRQGYEPCGMVELTKNFYELGRISGKSKYADMAEDVMLNHFTASFSPDYKQLHYVTCANIPMLTNYKEHAICNESYFFRRSHFIFTPNNRCCGHNTGMGWPWYAMNLWQATHDGGLCAWLYADCGVDTVIGDSRVRLKMTTAYPFDERVRIEILENSGSVEFPIYMRVPAWSKRTELRVNGKTEISLNAGGGYMMARSAWRSGDLLEICFSAEIEYTKWSNGSVTIDRGALSYSVRIGEKWSIVSDDAGTYTHPEPHIFENYEVLPTTPWNYGLCTENGKLDGCAVIKELKSGIEKQPWTPENAPIVLKARARRIPEWVIEDDLAAELQSSPAYTVCEEEEIELIPLGCARLRMSCLPTVTTDEEVGVKWIPAPAHTEPASRVQHYDIPYLKTVVSEKI